MDFGVQLFGCMDFLRKDPKAFLHRLAGIGYRQVEPCVAFSPIDPAIANHFWSPTQLGEFLEAAYGQGFAYPSFHAFGDLLSNLDAVKETVACHGFHHLVINGPRGDFEKEFPAFVDKARTLAKELREVNADLWLHNGGGEIRTKIKGKTFLEAVLEQCEGEIGVQVDVGWVLYGRENPVTYLDRVAPYLRSVHYKDLKSGYEALPLTEMHACLGDGCLDVRAVFQAVAARGVGQLIDQDYSERGFLEDLDRSLKLLQSFIVEH